MKYISLVCLMIASSVLASLPPGEQCGKIYSDGTYDYLGVRYNLTHSTTVVDAPTSYSAAPVALLDGVAQIVGRGVTINGKYITTGIGEISKLSGSAKSLVVPDGIVNFSFTATGTAFPMTDQFFWGMTGVEEVVFNKTRIAYLRSTEALSYYKSDRDDLFRGCVGLKRVILGDVPVFEGVRDDAVIRNLASSVEELYYPKDRAASWEAALCHMPVKCKYGAYTGEWTSVSCVVPGSGNLTPPEPIVVTNHVYTTVTNVIEHYTTVTNVVKYIPEPGTSPSPAYHINAGASGDIQIAGAAGWDAFNIPDGMAWNREAGMLEGQPTVPGTYDLLLVSGSGTDTKIMRTAITVSDYPTIVGYVGVAFSKCGAPLDQVAKTPSYPAGLKWANNVLSGVPTKAGIYKYTTKDNAPFTIEIKALPSDVVGTFDASVYQPPSYVTNGVARTCDILGTLSMTAQESGKMSVSVKTAQKSYSFSIASWTKLENGDLFTLEGTAALKTGEAIQVNAYVFAEGDAILLAKLTGGAFGDGCVTVLRKDIYAKSGKTWIDPEAHARMAQCAGTYIFTLTAVDEPETPTGVSDVSAWTLSPVAKAGTSFVKVVIKDTGAATITGTLPNKIKLNFSAKATATAADDKIVLGIVSAGFSGKTITLPIAVEINSDGSIVEGADNCGIVYYVKGN